MGVNHATLLQSIFHLILLRPSGGGEKKIQRYRYHHFNITIKMLNDSMGLCLPDGRVSRGALRSGGRPT